MAGLPPFSSLILSKFVEWILLTLTLYHHYYENRDPEICNFVIQERHMLISRAYYVVKEVSVVPQICPRLTHRPYLRMTEQPMRMLTTLRNRDTKIPHGQLYRHIASHPSVSIIDSKLVGV